jgi:hypothetical protein
MAEGRISSTADGLLSGDVRNPSSGTDSDHNNLDSAFFILAFTRHFTLGAADVRCSFLPHCSILICTLPNIRGDKIHKTTHCGKSKTSTV